MSKVVDVKKVSARNQIALNIASVILEKGLTNPYGGDVSLESSKKNFKYYSVSFSAPAVLDGVVRVIGENNIVIHTNRGDWTCFSEAEALRVIKEEF